MCPFTAVFVYAGIIIWWD